MQITQLGFYTGNGVSFGTYRAGLARSSSVH